MVHPPVLYLHTVVTDAAVGAARRSVEMTGSTPLHPHLDAPHVDVLVQWRSKLIVLVLVLIGWKRVCEKVLVGRYCSPYCSHSVTLSTLTYWENSRVHEGCHSEVGENKKEEDGTAGWHGGADGHRQPRASEQPHRRK